MARPESQALAGYFPTPPELLPSLASLLEFRPLGGYRRSHILVDPCAGDGEAIEALSRHWLPDGHADSTVTADTFGIELEAGRYQRLKARLSPRFSFHGDAFHFAIRGADLPGQGASLLFLNPPYDIDKLHGRLEQRFLERWTACLAPGAGHLVFIVPHYALAASAAFLAQHFEHLHVWRFPTKLFAAFRQCVLIARRRTVPVAENDRVRRLVERWAADPSEMPTLEPREDPLYRVTIELPQLELEQRHLDLARLVADFEPWRDSRLVAAHLHIREMIGAKYQVALPPRPAHIALALSAGMLNGKRLVPDHPGLPPLLVKGSLQRSFVTAEERFNKEGERIGRILVQRPQLTVHVLRLDTLEFHHLAAGSSPSRATEIAAFNTADLVGHYGASLGRLMREQFPALHDPNNPEHAMLLPPFARQPFSRQRELIAAGLKLIAQGENPIAAAEVGTGKSTVALSIAGALQPLHYAATTAELRRLGFDTRRLRPIRRMLIVCPPHLLRSWSDQAAAVLPSHRVVIVERLSDLERDGEIYLLTRERAKLGHGVRGLAAKRCPRCGCDVDLDSTTLATSRARCEHVRRLPQDRTARLAERLAALLVSSYPDDPHVRHLVKHRRVLRRSLPDLPHETGAPPQGASPRPADLRPLVLELVGIVEQRTRSEDLAYDIEEALHRLCLAATMQGEVRDHLVAAAGRYTDADVVAGDDSRGRWAPGTHLQDARGSYLAHLARRIMQDRPRYSDEPDALACLADLSEAGCWIELDRCGEPLYQAVPEPRRYPLARYITRRCRRRFDALVLDEAHEFSRLGSAQQKAAHRLVELPGVPTIALSGSMMGGYASSLFANLWALSPRFRRQFRRNEKQPFVNRFGYRRIYVPIEQDGATEVLGYGATTDREDTRESPAVRQLGEAPGIVPTFILEHLLPIGLIMHKSDLEGELPPCREVPVPIELTGPDPHAVELANEYRRLIGCLASRIRKDLYTKLAGKLWGAMSEMPSYLDRSTDDLPPFVLRYPDDVGGAVVAEAKSFPAAWLTPKERWLVDRLRQHLADGRNVLVFLRHTKTGLPKRYQTIFQRHLGEATIYLDATRVKAAEREVWLNEKVIDPGRRLLITNPKAVQTGLNNLVHFSAAIWAEGVDYDARVVRQANGRLHRIGQDRDVLIEIPYFAGTVQKTALDLVARKLTASVQVDGLSIEGALESAGASEDDEAVQAVMGMGQALYEAWMGDFR
jgi:hypothetical protein